MTMNAQSTVELNSGNEMPIIGVGTWQLTNQPAEMIAHALKLGFRMVDTSGDYGTQPEVGDAIRKSGKDRAELFVTTKVEETDDAYVATRQNLEELYMTYADLMLIHRPPEQGVGVELWEGLVQAQTDGFTKDIGVSNYSIEQIQTLIDATGIVPAVNQIEWTPFGHSMEMLGYCQENGIVIQAYSPLTRSERLNDKRLQEIASHYGRTPSQVLLRWDVQLGVVPIVKAGDPKHLAENIDIFNFKLSEQDMDELRNMNEAYSALGVLSYLKH